MATLVVLSPCDFVGAVAFVNAQEPALFTVAAVIGDAEVPTQKRIWLVPVEKSAMMVPVAPVPLPENIVLER